MRAYSQMHAAPLLNKFLQSKYSDPAYNDNLFITIPFIDPYNISL